MSIILDLHFENVVMKCCLVTIVRTCAMNSDASTRRRLLHQEVPLIFFSMVVAF